VVGNQPFNFNHTSTIREICTFEVRVNLESGKLRIRNATEDDAKLLCKWWNDGTIMAHAGFPNGIGINEKKVAELITPQEKTAEIGIKICDANMQNKGYGTEFM
jgi:RimJ/RimL family protein N-acetyltransferase